MKENIITRFFTALTMPFFGAVVVKLPQGMEFVVETTEKSRNLHSANVNGDTVNIPTGASVVINTPLEKISIKD